MTGTQVFYLVFGTDTEICDFDLTVAGEKDIAGFEISMNDPVLVEVIETLTHLPAYVGDLFFCQTLCQVDDNGVQGTAITKFNQHLKRQRRRKLRLFGIGNLHYKN